MRVCEHGECTQVFFFKKKSTLDDTTNRTRNYEQHNNKKPENTIAKYKPQRKTQS